MWTNCSKVAAARAARYLREIQERRRRACGGCHRPARGAARAVAGRPERAGRGARAARRGRLAGDDGHRRPALLRLRHRRRAAGRAGRELAGRRVGPERRPAIVDSPAAAALEEVALELAARPARPAAGTRGRASSPARRWPTSRALAAARHAVLARAGWDVEADGLFGAPPITVVVGEEAHPTLFKALGLLGLRARPRGARARRRPGPHARRRAAAARAGRRSSACRPAT